MECINFNKIKLSVDVEKRFCKIYESVISNYFLFSNELLSNTSKLLNSGKIEKWNKLKIDLLSYQFAFLLSFSVQDTCLSVQAFYHSLVDNTQIVQELLKNNQIKLLCLESESLPTVIGVCQVIDDIFEKFGCECRFDYLEIRVSVVEKRQGWRRLCECIVETVNSYFRNIDLILDFVDEFLRLSDLRLFERIRESDLVIIARFFAKYRKQMLKPTLKVRTILNCNLTFESGGVGLKLVRHFKIFLGKVVSKFLKILLCTVQIQLFQFYSYTYV